MQNSSLGGDCPWPMARDSLLKPSTTRDCVVYLPIWITFAILVVTARIMLIAAFCAIESRERSSTSSALIMRSQSLSPRLFRRLNQAPWFLAFLASLGLFVAIIIVVIDGNKDAILLLLFGLWLGTNIMGNQYFALRLVRLAPKLCQGYIQNSVHDHAHIYELVRISLHVLILLSGIGGIGLAVAASVVVVPSSSPVYEWLLRSCLIAFGACYSFTGANQILQLNHAYEEVQSHRYKVDGVPVQNLRLDEALGKMRAQQVMCFMVTLVMFALFAAGATLGTWPWYLVVVYGLLDSIASLLYAVSMTRYWSYVTGWIGVLIRRGTRAQSIIWGNYKMTKTSSSGAGHHHRHPHPSLGSSSLVLHHHATDSHSNNNNNESGSSTNNNQAGLMMNSSSSCVVLSTDQGVIGGVVYTNSAYTSHHPLEGDDDESRKEEEPGVVVSNDLPQ